MLDCEVQIFVYGIATRPTLYPFKIFSFFVVDLILKTLDDLKCIVL